MTEAYLITKLEAVGAILVFLTAALLHLHFASGWSSGPHLLAALVAINDSSWEHLKLAFWPGLFWAFIECGAVREVRREVLPIKGFSLLVTNILIVAAFQTYPAIVDNDYMILDIGILGLAIASGHVLSAHLLTGPRPTRGFSFFGWLLLLWQGLAIIAFTFVPPAMAFFIDPRTGARGIQ